nr:hypothetical protein [Solirubrobacterales bacterium]
MLAFGAAAHARPCPSPPSVVASGATAGEYTVQVTTPCGSLSSAPATLSILASCYANCDGSTIAPVLNVLDFNCFLNRFAAGCP